MSSYMAGDETRLQSEQPTDGPPLSPSVTQRSGYQITPGTDSAARVPSSPPSSKPINNGVLSRGNTLSKRASLRKRTSLRRTKSGRSLRAGSMKGMDDDDFYSVFHTPIPTTGTPTDTLANRFASWRKVLKDLIAYFREIQVSYESRSKALLKLQNVISGSQVPQMFLSQDGIDEANNILRNYHKHAVSEAKRAQDIETDVINQLSGLRNDLSQKIKEIKSLSGDFKNSVEKEKEHTRKAVAAYEDALLTSAHDMSAATGKNDPFIVRLSVEKQIERQVEEENYLHRAYLNLESSGRELESIVVGEIQKAYNAYASILKREADSNTNTVEELRSGPIAMPKDLEWNAFIDSDPHFVSPELPLRSYENMLYPGKFDPAAAEIRAGNLERKSKYLKSYTAGWYVLSSTHLHEYKSPDHIHLQQPVMSLCLLDQKLGSHSNAGSSSDKFSLKGAQTGGMHRGHSWVFRAESYDTMMAWYSDIRVLTEKSGAEKNAFIRQHARSASGGSRPTAASVSSDGIEDDEADAAPYAANTQKNTLDETVLAERPKRPEPGGRFPSDFDSSRADHLQAPLSPSSPSGSSGFRDGSLDAAAGTTLVSTDNTMGRNDEAANTRPLQEGPQPLQSDTPEKTTPEQKHPDTTQKTSALPTALSNQSGKQITGQDGSSNDSGPDMVAGGAAAGALGGLVATKAHDDNQRDEVSPDSALLSVGPQIREAEPTQRATTNADNILHNDNDDANKPSFEAVQTAQIHTAEGSSKVSSSNVESGEVDDAIVGDVHAHRTHQLFPSVIRHDTSTSVSQLHVPGEFPGRN